MKSQALFTSRDKSKKLKCCLLKYLFGALRVNNKLHLKLALASLGFATKQNYTRARLFKTNNIVS